MLRLRKGRVKGSRNTPLQTKALTGMLVVSRCIRRQTPAQAQFNVRHSLKAMMLACKTMKNLPRVWSCTLSSSRSLARPSEPSILSKQPWCKAWSKTTLGTHRLPVSLCRPAKTFTCFKRHKSPASQLSATTLRKVRRPFRSNLYKGWCLKL